MHRQTEMHQVVLKRPDGSLTGTIRTQAIGLHNRHIDDDQDAANALTFLMQLLLADASNHCFSKPNETTGLCNDAWFIILSFMLSFNPVLNTGLPECRVFDKASRFIPHTQQLGAVSIAFRKSTLFPVIKMNPDYLIEAVLQADEAMVLKIIAADPRYLTKTGTGVDLNGNAFTGTPLQAALHTTDIELCEKMKPYFDQMENGQEQWNAQVKAIYTKSLTYYINRQKAALTEQKAKQFEFLQLPTLNPAQTKQFNEVNEKIKQATRNIINYKSALASQDIHKMIGTHNQMQEDNAFDFQPYVNAICNATGAELDAVMELINATTPAATAASIARTGISPIQTDAARAKPFDQLTLVEKLNRFREEFVAHTQPEIIFNPNHMLTGLTHNDKTWNEFDAGHIVDPDYKKRIVIFSQLVGWSQQNAAEPIRQDIRQGTYYLTEEKEPRSRPARFNDWNSTDGGWLRSWRAGL